MRKIHVQKKESSWLNLLKPFLETNKSSGYKRLEKLRSLCFFCMMITQQRTWKDHKAAVVLCWEHAWGCFWHLVPGAQNARSTLLTQNISNTVSSFLCQGEGNTWWNSCPNVIYPASAQLQIA